MKTVVLARVKDILVCGRVLAVSEYREKACHVRCIWSIHNFIIQNYGALYMHANLILYLLSIHVYPIHRPIAKMPRMHHIHICSELLQNRIRSKP